MSNIGKLRNVGTDPDDTAADIKGTLRTLQWSLDVRVVRERDALDENRPSHRVFARNDKQQFIEVGAAWSKTIQRGENQGKLFLSATMDDPSFDKPLNFHLFEDEPGSWAVAWSRPRKQTK